MNIDYPMNYKILLSRYDFVRVFCNKGTLSRQSMRERISNGQLGCTVIRSNHEAPCLCPGVFLNSHHREVCFSDLVWNLNLLACSQ